MKGKILLVAVLVLLLCCFTASLAGVGYFMLSPTQTRPFVTINTPRADEQLPLGQEVTIHSIARDDQKIKRVELWVNGLLLDAQASVLPEGASPFPLVARWQPRVAGAYAITVRAFNTIGGRGHATVNVNVTQIADRDRDGVADDVDACPDQAGTLAASGCPDRDSDGVADANDACPDTPGLPDNRGCPAPSAQDRDGDGTPDNADACPDQAGSLRTAGCPDTDGDGVRDSEDRCPHEAGASDQEGCPTPGDRDSDGVPDASDACPTESGAAATAGCPDSDGDGVRDRDDACPDALGVPALAGCPDRDGDGVRDALDLCPAMPGPRENAGCPLSGAGDRDGDGVRDDADLAPDEPGSPDTGGAPVPGSGPDRDRDGSPDDEEPPEDPLDDLPEVLPGPRLSGVTFDALEFEVSEDYVARTEIYCYAGLGGRAVEQIGPFDSLGRRRWDIAEYAGGAHSRFVAIPTGTPLEVRAECYASIRDHTGHDHLFGLGSFVQNHPETDWDGHVITVRSSGGTGGRYFQAKYRICRGSCRSTDFPPPILHLFSVGGRRQFVWSWEGNRANIAGFKLYAGNFRIRLRANQSSFWAPLYLRPPCGERREFQLTAYRGDRESPHSNTVHWVGERCPRTVRITFERLRTGDLGRDGLRRNVGPIAGSFFASANREQRISFDTSDYRLRPNSEHSILEIFETSAREAGQRISDNIDTVTLDLGPNDDLTFGGIVKDEDFGRDDTLFNATRTLRAREIVPGEFTLISGNVTLIIRIEILGGP